MFYEGILLIYVFIRLIVIFFNKSFISSSEIES
jgi:hypothetical protein